jgi:DNA-binding NarL/FixJ family response regulator
MRSRSAKAPSNAEIARELFVSIATVKHMCRGY